MPAPTDTGLVARLGCAVEPWVQTRETINSTCLGGIRVVDDAVLKHERAHARTTPVPVIEAIVANRLFWKLKDHLS